MASEGARSYMESGLTGLQWEEDIRNLASDLTLLTPLTWTQMTAMCYFKPMTDERSNLDLVSILFGMSYQLWM